MIPTTFEGESVYLLHHRPDWSTSPQVKFSVVSETNRSLGGIEARRAYAHTLRTRFNFEIILFGHEQAAFRVALQRLEAKRVLCPFWPSAHLFYSIGEIVYTAPDGSFYTAPGGEVYTGGTNSPAPMLSGIWLTFEPDYSAYEVHTTDTPAGFTPSTNAIRVPLMLGRFDGALEPQPITSNLIECGVKFIETGSAAYALRPVASTPATGPVIAGGRTPKIFPMRPNWANALKAGKVLREIFQEEIGYGRNTVQTYYPQAGARGLSLGFTTFTWEQIAALTSFFHAHKGNVESFWLEGVCDEVVLTAPTSAGSAVVSVANAADIGDNRFIAFIAPGSDAATLRKILSVNTGANTITLDSAPGVFPTSTRVVSLILARFARPDLTINFKTDRVASATVEFLETPEEYDTQPDETYGTTHGALAVDGYLFRFKRYYPSNTTVNRFTSFERNIVANGELFEAKKISHADIVDSLEIERSRIRIKAEAFEGNPLMLFMPNRLEVPLWVEVLRCNPDADGIAGAPTLLFTGRVTSPRYKGRTVEVEAVHQLQDLQQLVPTFLIQPTCNYRLFTTPCGLLESAFTSTGTLAAATGSSITITGGSFSDKPAGYFAFGRIWFGTGETYQSRTIFNSTAATSGTVTLEIQGQFSPAYSGPVSFSPGCDGSSDSCKNKFSNHPRFGGFEFSPPGNPSLVPVKKSETPGGKK